MDYQRLTSIFDFDTRALEQGIQRAESLTKGWARSLGSNLANVKAGFDMVGGAAHTVGGFFFGLAKDAADVGSKFHDFSIQTGLSVETLSGLQLQLKQSGTDMDALARATVIMQRNLGEAAGGSKEMQRAFAAIGVKDVNAALRDTDGTLRTVTKSLGAAGSAGERNAEGAKVMGKGFKDLSVFLEDTHGDLSAVIEESRRAGRVMSGEATDAADAFGDQLDALTNAASIAGRTVGLEAIPQITGAMRDLTGATEGNIGVLRSWAKELGSVIQFARIATESMAAWSIFDSNISYQKKVKDIADRIGREDDIAAGKRFDLNAPITPEQASRGERERARALAAVGLRPQGGGGADVRDFFGGSAAKGALTEAQKARKQFIERLHEWAETFNIPRAALREVGSQSKVHKGWAHKAGMAADVSPQYMRRTPSRARAAPGLTSSPNSTRATGRTAIRRGRTITYRR